jgi:hypothetical protein
MKRRQGELPERLPVCPWDTWVGTIGLQIPKLRHGTYFPGWLLEPRRRAEKALTAVVAEDQVEAMGALAVAQGAAARGHPQSARTFCYTAACRARHVGPDRTSQSPPLVPRSVRPARCRRLEPGRLRART